MDEEKRGPGRPRKLERRRKGSVGQIRTKLTVDEAMLDRNTYEYRFVNDDGGRVAQMSSQDDWDLVQGPSKAVAESGTDLGASVSMVVGKDESGQPMRAYLMRKRKEWYDEDKAEAQALIDRKMQQIKRGPVPNEGIGADPGHSYVPTSGIKVQEGSRR